MLPERDWGASRHVPSFCHQFKTKRGIRLRQRQARCSGGRCLEIATGGDSEYALVLSAVQEEARRLLWSPPSQVLGRCLRRATWGQLAISARFAFISRRSAVSALGIAEHVARAVLAVHDWGAARHVLSYRREFKKKCGVGFGNRRTRCSGGACRTRLGGGWPCPLASPPDKAEMRRRLWAPRSQWLRRCMQSAT